MRFCISAGLVVLFAGTSAAVDYDRVERRLVKEPAYQTKAPGYALLLFGPDAKLAVWVVLDGEAVYVDRNGNGDLTDAGERFAKETDCKGLELADPDGKTRYAIRSLQTDHSFYTPAARQERQAKGLPPSLTVNVAVTGAAEYQQYCDVQEVRGDPGKAMLAHFHGPLLAEVRTINWKLPESTALRTGPAATILNVNIGTMSAKHGCWVVVRTCDGEKGLFPDGVRPVAEVTFPAAAGAAPVKRTYLLDDFCCGAIFKGKVPVPEGVGPGKAEVRLTFDAWKAVKVAPGTVELPVKNPEPSDAARK